MNDFDEDRNAAKDDGHEPAGRRQGRVGRKARMGIAAAALLGLGAVAGGLATVSMTAGAHMWRGHGGHGMEAMTERARDRVSWVASRVDATPEQERQLDAIVTELMSQLGPVRSEHRVHRRELMAELLRDNVDSDRLETIRRDELRLAETASQSLVDALVRASEVLTPEQRTELLERFTRHRH